MRILLAQNSLYYPAHGGGDKSNRLLLEALAARGHQCRAVARIAEFGERGHARYVAELAARGVEFSAEGGMVRFERNGVGVHVATQGNLRAHFEARIAEFAPDAILASTDDPAQVLLEAALRSPSRVVYLARATLALPFGPDCAFPSQVKTERLRQADLVVGVSRYVADYMGRYAGIEAIHVPISLPDAGPAPRALGSFENEFVTLVNPCAVKGVSIFLALADAFRETRFAAVPTWGTNQRDLEALRARANIALLQPVDDIDVLLARTRVLLAPSLWAEARSRMIVEAMARGVPVMAAAVGGIPEAKMGIPYLLPVNPIVRYQTRLDEQMVPVAEVPEQDTGPWREALARLLTDRAHWGEIAAASRAAALEYAEKCTVEAFEGLLVRPRVDRLKPVPPLPAPPLQLPLSAERQKLLALRLRKRAPAGAWFPGADAIERPRLFCFPHAGGGASAFAGWALPGLCPVRLPGRESRIAEAAFERMAPLVEALAAAIEPYTKQGVAFFGHSMGAVVAFELARELRRRGLPLPRVLIASGARAPQFRRNHTPPPDPSDDQLLDQLRSLEGTPQGLLEDPLAVRAVLPALRADTRLYRHYVYAEEAPLDCAIRAYGGVDDAHVTYAHLEAWAEQTGASFAVRRFPGGHFYLRAAPPELLRAIAEDLA
jgi:surfactin synthase thioesterase subunit/glycosyltransferase involved in cell wall biosynthesis